MVIHPEPERGGGGGGEGATDRRGAAEAGDPREIQERRMRRFPIFPDDRRRPRYARQDRGAGEGRGVRGDTRRAERRTNGARIVIDAPSATPIWKEKKERETHICVCMSLALFVRFSPSFLRPFLFPFFSFYAREIIGRGRLSAPRREYRRIFHRRNKSPTASRPSPSPALAF